MEVLEPVLRMLNTPEGGQPEKIAPCDVAKNTDFDSLWHPYFVLFLLHCVVAATFAVLSLKAPLVTTAIILLSGLTFLISALAGLPIWGHEPGSYLWIGVFIKWLIVDLTATVPVLLMRGCNFKKSTVRMMGIPIYVILGSNVIWTMFHKMDNEDQFIVVVNRIAGGALTISLIFHCVAVCRAGYDLFEVRNGFPYGFGTSYAWILCYTVWNILFAARIGIGTTLQDFLFWALMSFYKHWDDKHLPVELYFGFARPVQLGSYIAFTEAMGAFVPWFYEAPTLKELQPLPVYSNTFILFVAFMNMLWSFCVVFWSTQRLVFGLGFFQERFEAVHKIGESPEEREEMLELSDGDYEEGSTDEEEGDERRGCVIS